MAVAASVTTHGNPPAGTATGRGASGSCNVSAYPCIQTEALVRTDIRSDRSTRDRATQPTSLANLTVYDNPQVADLMDLLHGTLPLREPCVYYINAIGTTATSPTAQSSFTKLWRVTNLLHGASSTSAASAAFAIVIFSPLTFSDSI